MFESQRVSHYEVSMNFYTPLMLLRRLWIYLKLLFVFFCHQGKKHAQRVRIYLQTKKAERNKQSHESSSFQVNN